MRGLFAGMCCLDFVFEVGRMPKENCKVKTGSYRCDAGGPALNAAISCARLGGDAELLTALGEGPFSDRIRRACAENSVRITDLTPGRPMPNMSFVGIGRENSTRTIVSGQLPDYEFEIPSESFYDRFDYCLYDCNLPSFSKQIAEVLSSRGVPLALDLGSWKENAEHVLAAASIAISSETFRDPAGEDVFGMQSKYRIGMAAMTRGERTVLASEADGGVTEIPVRAKHGVSTLGAGDMFHGFFCYYHFCCGLGFLEALGKSADRVYDELR